MLFTDTASTTHFRELVAPTPLIACLTTINMMYAVDPSERKVYFSFLERQDIVKVNGETNEVETVIEMEAVPWDLVADPLTHRVYASTKFSDYVIAIGPESISASFPVVTLNNPVAVLGIIRAHAQDVVVSEPTMDIATRTLLWW
jgi:DNA-binding beta-propeller fold protein YncE